ncbi:hypothetical protein Amet_4556 [Alkaliphilus metalliredigens QYMF]|uniref:Uncharacterized protein n=1 Tax=Alkaliphilus metalliredigens (strain QYMF) TaxID=293826 RepID=A6TWR0_ALKMQ|nr:hypothetical protein [Alkaliphilus metalliredigens]ABR50628.1 hypothetical protein Amet_4556 [Alkaliphilus metalliredigens QYMF]
MGKKAQPTKQTQQLIKAYEKGKFKYIFRHGVLNWGITTGFIFLLIVGVVRNGLSLSQISEDIFSTNGILTLMIFCALGAVWGNMMWGWIKKEVEKGQYNQGKKAKK